MALTIVTTRLSPFNDEKRFSVYPLGEMEALGLAEGPRIPVVNPGHDFCAPQLKIPRNSILTKNNFTIPKSQRENGKGKMTQIS